MKIISSHTQYSLKWHSSQPVKSGEIILVKMYSVDMFCYE